MGLAAAVALVAAGSAHADELGDLAPAGAEDGLVELADVDLALQAIVDPSLLDAAAQQRGDVAPILPIGPRDPPPQEVRPNPSPTGPLDLGDAVVIHRRALGLVAFSRVNQPPTVSLLGDGDVTGNPASYTVSGYVHDDGVLAGVPVKVYVDGVATVLPALADDTGFFSKPVYPGLEGPHVVTAYATDDEGFVGLFSDPITYHLDVTPPALAITQPATNPALIGELRFEVQGTATDLHGIASVLVQGAPAALIGDRFGRTVGLTEGDNELVVVATDVAGNVTTATTILRADTTSPAVVLDPPTPDPTNQASALVTGHVDDLNGIAFVVVGDGAGEWLADLAPDGALSVTLPVVEGINRYVAIAFDSAGNATTSNVVTLVGDFTPPTVWLASSPFVPASPTDIVVQADEPIDVLSFRGEDYVPPLTGSDTYSLSGVVLAEGPNGLALTVRDRAGNLADGVLGVTFDGGPPSVTITEVSNPSAAFEPPGDLDGVSTNAAFVTVRGVVSDAGSAVANVVVNGRTALVTDGEFTATGVGLLPRDNLVRATAADLAGNTAADEIAVYQDIEGPVLTLDLAHGTWISNRTPVPPGARDGTVNVPVSGVAVDHVPIVEGSLAASIEDIPLGVSGTPTSFTFVLPASDLALSDLKVIEVRATDALGNTTVDVYGALDGEIVRRGLPVPDAAGVGLGPGALYILETLLETQVEGMSATSFATGPFTLDAFVMTLYVTLHGISFCNPPNRSAPPAPLAVPPNNEYGCRNDVVVDLSLGSGGVGITLTIPTLFVDLTTSRSENVLCFECCGFWPCECDGTKTRSAYGIASPVTVSLVANFVTTSSGTQLEPVPGSVNVALSGFDLNLDDSCVDTLVGIAEFFGLDVQSILEDSFEGQIDSLLGSVNDFLTDPMALTSFLAGLEGVAPPDFAMEVSSISNDASGLYLWMNVSGNPCPTAGSFTNELDADGNPVPCPDPPKGGPGSLRSASARPSFTMRDAAGAPVSVQAALNDDLVNFLSFSMWAQGMVDFVLDGETLGDSLTLDTTTLATFLPELGTRSDITALVPLGAPVALFLDLALPPRFGPDPVEGPPAHHDLLVSLGDLFMDFRADTDRDGVHETQLFRVASSFDARLQYELIPAAGLLQSDVIDVVLLLDPGDVRVDLVDNPLILPEPKVRALVPSLLALVLPSLGDLLTNFTLPGSGFRFRGLVTEGQRRASPPPTFVTPDYLRLDGDLLHEVDLVQPGDGTVTNNAHLPAVGEVTGLQRPVSYTLKYYVVRPDGSVVEHNVRTSPGATADAVSFDSSSYTTGDGLLAGDNEVRIVVTDHRTGLTAYAAARVTYDPAAPGTTLGESGGCGCGPGAEPAGPYALLALLGGLVWPRRRRPPVSALVALVLLAQCGGTPPDLPGGDDGSVVLDDDDGDDDGADDDIAVDPPDFTGEDVVDDPVVVLAKLGIGTDRDGFNLDEVPAAGLGDPYPDNALAGLGGFVNDALQTAVDEGSVLILLQLEGLTRLPAPGEGAFVSMTGYVGVDLDADPADNFNGAESFAIDPSSFDLEGAPLIRFPTAWVENVDGAVTLHAGPSEFLLLVPLSDEVDVPLLITQTQLEGTLSRGVDAGEGAPRVVLASGLLGGIVPAASLAVTIDTGDFSVTPLPFVAANVDIDLDGDGVLDTTPTEANADGLSVAIVIEAVGAGLSDAVLPVPPVLVFDPAPEEALVVSSYVVTGLVLDPDGDVALTTVALWVGEGAEQQAPVDAGGQFELRVELVHGDNAVHGRATDAQSLTDEATLHVRYDDPDHVDDDDLEPPPDDEVTFTGADVADHPVILMASLGIGRADEGFNVDELPELGEGDPEPDNALSTLGFLANDSLAGAIADGSVLVLLRFEGLRVLPAEGEAGYVSLDGYLGIDEDLDPSDNFTWLEDFLIDPDSYAPSGVPYIHFDSVVVRNTGGVVRFSAGPSDFDLSLPVGDDAIQLHITETQIRGTLFTGPDDPVEGVPRLGAESGLLGGVVPAATLATPIELDGSPLVPLSFVASLVDVDLNRDGALDHGVSADNPDGLSVGIVFDAVGAGLPHEEPPPPDDEPEPLPPTLTLDDPGAEVGAPALTLTGRVTDPDGDVQAANVEVALDTGASVSVAPAADGSFAAEVHLTLGPHTATATVTDVQGLTASAERSVALVDTTVPLLLLTEPTAGTRTSSLVLVAGRATDAVGLAGVQIQVDGVIAAVIPAAELGADGSFAVEVDTGGVGTFSFTATARDTSGNLFHAGPVRVVVADVDAPVVTLDGPPSPIHRTPATVTGTVRDNAGLDGLSLVLSAGGAPAVSVPVQADGTFSRAVPFALGTTGVLARAYDAAGNIGQATLAVTLSDDELPVIALVSPVVSDTSAYLIELAVTDDFGVASVTVSVGGGPELATLRHPLSGRWRVLLELTAGPNLVAVRATDTSGNQATLAGTILHQDLVPPTVTLDAPADGLATFTASVTASGRVADNTGPIAVIVSVGASDFAAPVDAGGRFSVVVPLAAGTNSISATATDAVGNAATTPVAAVTHTDPDTVSRVTLAAAPLPLVVSDPSGAVVTALVERAAGGPVPDGTVVTFDLAPAGLATLSDLTALTVGGVASVGLTAGSLAGAVALSAVAGAAGDGLTLLVVSPTAVSLDVCSSGADVFTGLDFTLSYAGPAVLAGGLSVAPGALAPEARVLAGATLPARVLLSAGVEVPYEGVAAVVTLPVASGNPLAADFALGAARFANVVGAVASTAALRACAARALLGRLPPVVRLAALPASVTDPAVTLSGSVEAEDLAAVSAIVQHDATVLPLDVASGSFSVPLLLAPGPNLVTVTVTDDAGATGSDSLAITYVPPNAAPQVTFEAPGDITSDAEVAAAGRVSDDGGATSLSVSVRVGSGAPVAAVVGADGTWSASVALALGANTVRVTVTDVQGAAASVTRTLTRVPPIAPPVVTIAAPADGAVVSLADLTVSGSVAEGGDATGIIVAVSGEGPAGPLPPALLSFSPFSRLFTAQLVLADGLNHVTVTATDITGGAGSATIGVSFVAPNLPPAVAITEPADGLRTAVTQVTVRGTVSDDRPLSLLAVEVTSSNGGAPVRVAAVVDTAAGTFFAVVPVAAGLNSLEVVATDNAAPPHTVSDVVSVTIVPPPIVILSSLQVGGPSDGFNLDEDPATGVGDPNPDNALFGLAGLANAPLQEAITQGDLISLVVFEGLVDLPGPGESTFADVSFLAGEDLDGDPTDNFSGSEPFAIDADSYDASGEPFIRYRDVLIENDGFGTIAFDTFAQGRPSVFGIDVPLDAETLHIGIEPAYVAGRLAATPTGIALPHLLVGGVVPAATLAIPVDLGDLTIVPLQLLVTGVDVDLDHDGHLDTTTADATNPDGLSIGLVGAGVPARLP